MIAVNGVRSSWLMWAMNALLARLASSAASFERPAPTAPTRALGVRRLERQRQVVRDRRQDLDVRPVNAPARSARGRDRAPRTAGARAAAAPPARAAAAADAVQLAAPSSPAAASGSRLIRTRSTTSAL
jgi:septal ring-binding cell division protein DamX